MPYDDISSILFRHFSIAILNPDQRDPRPSFNTNQGEGLMINSRNLLCTATFIALALVASAVARADDEKKPGSGPNPYADCGIGAALFTETKWAAVISNVIWDLGTTAVISATASPQTCSGKKVEAALFIHHSYDNLAEETASGRGEHLTTVLNIFECDSAHHANAVQQIRSDMGRAVANPNYIEKSHIDRASEFYFIIDKAVSASCPA